MRVIAVDDERIALDGILRLLKKILPDAEIEGYSDPVKALGSVEEKGCDVAVLDIEMRNMNGIDAARTLMERDKPCNIIFTTGYSEYTGEAFALHASGYLLKPISEKALRRELADLRYPVRERRPELKVKTFGNFEVYADGQPVHFRYSKSKELLAYLVDRRGTFCSNGELIGVLWDEAGDTDSTKSYLKNVRSDLVNTLSKLGLEGVVRHQRNRTGIDPEQIDCDFYRWLKNEARDRETYTGEYMQQYSWSEFTHGWIDSMEQERKNRKGSL